MTIRQPKAKIILEGPDGAGKTTVISELIKRVPFSMKHHIAPVDAEQARIETCKMLVDLNKPDGIIFDRCFLSEAIYGPIFRNHQPTYLADVVKLVPSSVFYIQLTAELSDLEDRYDGEYIEKKQLANLQQSYIDMYKNPDTCMPNRMLFNTSKKSVETIVSVIISVIENAGYSLSN